MWAGFRICTQAWAVFPPTSGVAGTHPVIRDVDRDNSRRALRSIRPKSRSVNRSDASRASCLTARRTCRFLPRVVPRAFILLLLMLFPFPPRQWGVGVVVDLVCCGSVGGG